MRYLFGFMCVLALGVMPMIGCGETEGTGGSGGEGGQGGVGGGVAACVDNVCPCTEAGIRAAIAEGGGPYTFDCDGQTTVRLKAEIGINSDVILHGEGNLRVSGDHRGRVFSIGSVTVALDGIYVGGGYVIGFPGGGGILNGGVLTLNNCDISGNFADSGRFPPLGGGDGGGGILNFGRLTLTNSLVRGNATDRGPGAGILSIGGSLTIINSTIAQNIIDQGGQGAAIAANDAIIINSTISENVSEPGNDLAVGATMMNTIVEGRCGYAIVSGGYNMESPGDTCGFDQDTDQVDVASLWTAVLRNNGGPTSTYALLAPSPAIDVIPAAECVDADGEPLTTDQRGFPRDTMCDVGAFEVQP